VTELPPTHEEPARSTAAEVGRGAAWLVGSWLLNTVVGGAVLFSLLAILAGFAGDGAGWLVAGLAIGLPGAVLPFVAAHRWQRPWRWLVPVAVLVVSFGLVVAVAASS
jgi:hypothetical protein